jgi:hypothetical protein
MTSSIPAAIIVCLVSALLLAALYEATCAAVRFARRALSRHAELRSELSGDWGARLERELHAYIDDRRPDGVNGVKNPPAE